MTPGTATPAFIALGSNLDDPAQQLKRAVAALSALPESRLDAISSVYSSAAVGPGDQPDYLNAVALISTDLAPQALLAALQKIERDQGRVRLERWGPRTLDLDILLFGDLQMDSPDLTIPHPCMHERDFVLYPLREISNTNLVLPNGMDIDSILKQLKGAGLKKTQYKLRGGQ